MIKDPDVADVFYRMTTGDLDVTHPAMKRRVEGMVMTRLPNLISSIWAENYIYKIMENDKDGLLTGPLDLNLSIDAPVNIEATKEDIDIQLDKIFSIDKLETDIQ